MITRLGRRLRIALRRRPEKLPAGDAPLRGPVLPPQVEFVAYGEDCILSGYVRMAEDRLTDLLNGHEEYQLLDVYAEDLASGIGFDVPEVVVDRNDLLLVHAIGPRGNQGRRQRTRQHPVGMQVGPFHVRGYIHALPGSDPIAGFRRRRPMVPLTDAWIEYSIGTNHQRRRVGAVVVNRLLVDWIVPAIDDEVEMPDIPLSAYPQGPLLKDFTGRLKVE